MKPVETHAGIATTVLNFSTIKGKHRHAVEALFAHPLSHNIPWSHIVGLIEAIGICLEKPNGEFVLEVAGTRHVMRKPHSKDLTSSEVMDLRHFLKQAGYSPDLPSQPAVHADPAAPSLLIVVDHHGTKIFDVDVSPADVSEHVIRPYDPHHFLHHLVHKDQLKEQGQRAPEESAYYEKIAAAVAFGGKIVVVGHGTGKSNAAHHLTEYLKSHHSETYQRVVREIDADLSSITAPQLLALARDALHE
jgi:hypothetical protein